VGGGHVMRCLALADALQRLGARCDFACAPEGAALITRFGGGAFPVRALSDGRVGSLADGADIVVFDSYRIDAAMEGPVRAAGCPVAVIDDLADRPHDCDLLLDPGYGRTPADYAGRVPPAAVVLTGPAYALLRSGFASLPVADRQRDCRGPVRRVFLSFGLSDPGGVAVRVYDALRARLQGVEVDLALADGVQSLPLLQHRARSDRNLHLHVNATGIEVLMARADLAIGAGGGSTWERAALHLPTLAVIVAENQRQMITRLTEAGAVLSVALDQPGFDAALGTAYDRLQDGTLRQTLADHAAGLCDGRGADRAAAAVLALLPHATIRAGT
jgi:UDP-2,4-diacetamido-2,4,6-trideoxy-beta-L-altropyranose hydrolase